METNHTQVKKDVFSAGLANKPVSSRWLLDQMQGVAGGENRPGLSIFFW